MYFKMFSSIVTFVFILLLVLTQYIIVIITLDKHQIYIKSPVSVSLIHNRIFTCSQEVFLLKSLKRRMLVKIIKWMYIK